MMGDAAARKPNSRAMISPVNWTVLGLVLSKPSYGLEIARRLEREYGDVLSISSESQVYAALDSLESRGLIESAPGIDSRRQPKTQYRATGGGVRAFQDYLVEQVEAESRRQELWVRQLAVFVDSPQVALGVLDRFENEYLRVSGGSRSTPQGERAKLIDAVASDRRATTIEGMLKWLSRARGHFEAAASHSGGHDAA